MKIRFNHMALISCLSLFFALSDIVDASIRYVSTDGDNTHDGAAPNSAWKTIAFATARVTPGDSILVAPGDYGNEQVTIYKNGTAEAPITLTRFGSSGKIVITSSGSMTGNGLTVNADYWIIEHFHTKNYSYGIIIGTNGEHNVMRDCTAEGNGTDAPVVKVEYRGFYITGNNNRIENCQAHNIGNKGRDERKFGYGSGMRIEGDNNYILNFRSWSNGHFGIAIDNTPENPAAGNTIEGGEFWDIVNDTAVAAADARDTTMKNIYVHDGQSGLRSYEVAYNTTMKDCVISNVHYGIRVGRDGIVSNIKIRGDYLDDTGIDNWHGTNVVYDRIDVECGIREYEFRGSFSNAVIRDQVNQTYRILTIDGHQGEPCGTPIIEYTTGKVFREESGTASPVYYPNKSQMKVPVGAFATWTIKAYDMYVKPAGDSASVSVKTFSTSREMGNTLVDFTASSTDGNEVSFTIDTLKPNVGYLVKKDGLSFRTVTSNEKGRITFENRIWTKSHNFTVEQANGPSGMKKGELSPEGSSLWQNYPNPFNPSTTIRFRIEKDEWISLKVFNTSGQEVCTLAEGNRKAGIHTVMFKPGNSEFDFANGVYFYRLETRSAILTRKFVFIK